MLIKTQGSDTKLVAQMQPYYEAKTLSRRSLNGISIPPLVSQIGDGENGGVMMNEFPPAFKQAWYQMAEQGGKSGVVGINGTEYLELLEAAGVKPEHFPTCQAIGQHQIWQRVPLEQVTPEAVDGAIAAIRQENPNFHMEGSSWTNDRSWVKDYDNVLTPMNQLSAHFHQTFDPLLQAQDASAEPITRTSPYRKALLYNLLLQTSCFRYWGQGAWTEYAREFYRQGERAIG